MATCPFCAAGLVVTAEQHLEDSAGITNGAGLGDFVCPMGGSRFRYAVVPRYPKHIEHWYLLLDDDREVCLRAAREPIGEESRFLWCSECGHPDGRRMCTKPHTDTRGRPIASCSEETALEAVHSLESREIEGVTVAIEVTQHRCATHGDAHDPHLVIRRQPGP